MGDEHSLGDDLRGHLAATGEEGVEVRGWRTDGTQDLVSVGLSDSLGEQRPQLLELVPLPGALLVMWQGGSGRHPLRMARLHG